MASFSVAGEGVLDLAVGRQLLEMHNHEVYAEFDKRGKDKLDASLRGFLNASRFSPWLVLRDFDNNSCVVSLLNSLSADRDKFPNLILRICIRSVESWILADLDGLSQFFGVAVSRIPTNPDSLCDPKRSLVACASFSRHRNLRDGVTPRSGSGRRVGPEYNAVLTQFVSTVWDANRAAEHSPSLRRAIARIQAF